MAISPDTASASEAVAYHLKNVNRVTLVGEKTAGAANPGRTFHIGYGYSAFIPQGRGESPVTQANWEGVGISPDVPVAADQAVSSAHRLALETVAENGTDPARKALAEKALATLSQ